MRAKTVYLLVFLVYITRGIDPHTHVHPINHESGNHCVHNLLLKHQEEHNIKPQIVDNGLPVFLDTEKRTVTLTRQGEKPHHDPIRIYVASETLLNDPYTCYEAGTVIQALSMDATTTQITYTCTQPDVLTATKRDYLLNKLLADSVLFLESALSVYRSQGNLTMNSQQCTLTSLSVPVPSKYITQGVDADFIIFPTARPLLGSAGTLAFAGQCASLQNRRPIAGNANFNASGLIDDPSNFRSQRGLVTHELTHALGFSPSNYPTSMANSAFIKYTGYNEQTGQWAYSFIPMANVYQSFSDPTTGWSYGTIITPLVKQTVQEHYNCPQAIGGQLEDAGTSGTVGAHWEKRLYMNEYMTGSASEYPVFSKVTLSLLEDSGWYEVDYSVADPLQWGYNLGCAFLADCGGWTSIPNIPQGFCDDHTSPELVTCTFDRRAYGYCNIINDYSSDLPVYYRHYQEQPRVGGQNMLADYCGYVGQQGDTVFCNLGGTGTVVQGGDTLISAGITETGEQFEMTSRCYYSTLSRLKTSIGEDSVSPLLVAGARAARCYNTSCVDQDDLRIQVDGIWYPCVDGMVKPLGYGGAVECPPPLEICSGVARDTTWPRLVSVYPKSGPPGTVITLSGDNFDTTSYTYSVFVESPCTDVQVIDRQTIIATVPPVEDYADFINIYFFQTQKSVVVMDSRNYTAYRPESFTILVALDINWMRATSNWMNNNPLWAFLIWACILIPLCVFCTVCCKILVRKRGMLPGVAHRMMRKDQYKDEDFTLEDTYEAFSDQFDE